MDPQAERYLKGLLAQMDAVIAAADASLVATLRLRRLATTFVRELQGAYEDNAPWTVELQELPEAEPIEAEP